MSGGLKSGNEYSFDIEELLQIGKMCRELRKEKDMLKESQSKSAEEIKRLELDVKSLSEARLEDKQYILQLERELKNSSEEIGHWQEQLNLRNNEANYLGEHVHSLELKLKVMEKLRKGVNWLKEDLLKSNSQCMCLMQELKKKEMELHSSTLCIEKLEEMISYTALESECEIESVKLDIIALEQRSFEAKKLQDESTLEKARMDDTVEKLAAQFLDSQKAIERLNKENKDLREKLEISESNARIFVQKAEEYFRVWLESKDISLSDIQTCSENGFPVSREVGTCKEILDPLLSKLAVVVASGENLKDKMGTMSHQIHEYEDLVKQLKDELREEKSKAKEEAEDLIQEMAELRYQFTGMLEEECKRRASIEQASLQRISDLELQVLREQRKSSSVAVNHTHEVQKLVEHRSEETHQLKILSEGSCTSSQKTEVCSCGGC